MIIINNLKRVIKFKIVEDLSLLEYFLPFDYMKRTYKINNYFRSYNVLFSKDTMQKKVVKAADSVNYIISNRLEVKSICSNSSIIVYMLTSCPSLLPKLDMALKMLCRQCKKKPAPHFLATGIYLVLC